MNLLFDDWIPATCAGRAQQIGLRTLLCGDQAWELSLPRDDMELAALQLLISLVQCIAAPPDRAGLRERIRQPMTEAELAAAAALYRDWFDLDHSTTPFMQTRGVSADKMTPIQKLFIGLPEGNNHKFFDPEGAITTVCGGCATIALFNQASCCPSFGGGFKGSLRGSAPITTLVDAPDLRQRIWENVLPQDQQSDWQQAAHDLPSWIAPVQAGETIYAVDIGLRRGLFWQPARIELSVGNDVGTCGSCGHSTQSSYTGFFKEKFNYTVDGLWTHPHSPLTWRIKNGQPEQRYASFTTIAPAWTQLTQFVIETPGEAKEGHRPAAVVTAGKVRRRNDGVQLLVGGYRNNQASVIERRHELFSFSKGWVDALADLHDFVQIGLAARKALYGSLMWAAKGQKDGFKGIGMDLHKASETAFFQRSESMIHVRLRELDAVSAEREKTSLRSDLRHLVIALYDEAVAPYRHDAELMHAIAAGRGKLFKELGKEGER
jgi:CRISPR system Cascade subunit CasA